MFFVAIIFQTSQFSVRWQTPQAVNCAKQSTNAQREIDVQAKAFSNVAVVFPFVFTVLKPTSYDGLATAKV